MATSSFMNYERAFERRPLTASEIVAVFDALFWESHRTCLRGGADEPLYQPADDGAEAQVVFRKDFAASALHEVAHWSIAGPERRRRVDYGYWYAGDGRGDTSQDAFARAEAKPQALEWIFAQAAGIKFHLSLDNLDAPPPKATVDRFANAVYAQGLAYKAAGLPARASRFFCALGERRGHVLTLKQLAFSRETLW